MQLWEAMQQRFSSGPHAGRRIGEVLMNDRDYLLVSPEHMEACGAVLYAMGIAAMPRLTLAAQVAVNSSPEPIIVNAPPAKAPTPAPRASATPEPAKSQVMAPIEALRFFGTSLLNGALHPQPIRCDKWSVSIRQKDATTCVVAAQHDDFTSRKPILTQLSTDVVRRFASMGRDQLVNYVRMLVPQNAGAAYGDIPGLMNNKLKDAPVGWSDPLERGEDEEEE